MPRLYSIADDFGSGNFSPAHFFPSASWGRHWSSSVSSWSYDLNADFPDQTYIHTDKLEKTDTHFWIALRKDVERNYCGDCFYIKEDMDYRRWWNRDATSEYNREYDRQRHGYWTFFFEEKSDKAMFVLKHAEMLSSKKYRFHPDYGISCEDRRYDVPMDEEIPNVWRMN